MLDLSEEQLRSFALGVASISFWCGVTGSCVGYLLASLASAAFDRLTIRFTRHG